MLGREHVFGHPAITDETTGLANRLHFELVYSYLFEGADRGVPLTVLLVATQADERARLTTIGATIQRITRTSDLVAHLEDGRFAVLLLGTNLAGGRIAADRLEEALERVTSHKPALGLATYHPDMKEPHLLLELADKAVQTAAARGGGLEMV